MVPQTEKAMSRIRACKTYEERQAMARQIYKERNPPLTRFDKFMNYAVFFGPIVIGVAIALVIL
jgi:hypothetical protein